MTSFVDFPAAADRFTPGRFEPIDRIVLHTTTTTWQNAINIFQGGSRLVSAHYVIDKNLDRIARVVAETDTAWHAGNWEMNKRSIGIEHADDGDYDGLRPDGLYVRSAALVREVAQRWGIPLDRDHILDHRWVSATACPDALDTDRIVRMALVGGNVTSFALFGPSRGFVVPTDAHPDAVEWAALYKIEAPRAGIRAEMAFAQALKETAKFNFGGVAQREWNNPAGLGVTGAAGVGNRFPTKLEGVRAHLQHLIWYLASTLHVATPYCTPLSDQRHFGEHKQFGNDVRILNGKWAIPGVGYGESITTIADSLPQPMPVPVLTPEQEAHRVYELAEANAPIVYISRLQRGLDVERGDTFDPTRPPLDPRIDRRGG